MNRKFEGIIENDGQHQLLIWDRELNWYIDNHTGKRIKITLEEIDKGIVDKTRS